MVSIVGFVGHSVSVATTQLKLCSTKAATDNMDMSGCGGVPIKSFKKGWVFIFISEKHSFPSPHTTPSDLTNMWSPFRCKIALDLGSVC